jgi:signal transduction histidine kinase/ligand-binding sensor domain-containing protein/DNA-binding response OmpR family regulator
MSPRPLLARVRAGVALAAALTALALATTAGGAAPAPEAPAGFVVESWSVREGLPTGECSALAQTRDGYLWLATADGLARFDGVRFRVFDTRVTPGLASNRVTSLLETRDGTLWFTTDDAGVGALRDGRVTLYPSDSCLAGGAARRLLETADGSLWVSHTRGLSRWRAGRMAPVAPGELREGTLVMSDDGAGGLWTSTRTGVAHVTDRGVRRWRLETDPAEGGWWQPFRDARGRVWLATHRGLRVLQGDAFVPFTAPGLADDPWRILYDDPTSEWPAVRSGGAFARVVDGGWRTYRPGPVSRFKTDPVWDGPSMWYAVASGLYRDGALMLALPGDATGLLRDREGSLWIATASDGLFRLRAGAVTVAGATRIGIDREVTAIGVEDDGGLWIGGRGPGPLHVRDGVERAAPAPPASLRRIHDWIREGPGRYLASTSFGVERVWLSADRPARSEPVLAGAGLVSALAQEPDGTLWAAGEPGVMRRRGGAWTVVPDSLLGTRARATTFRRDPGGRMWIGTDGGGVLVMQGDRATRIAGAEGLPGGSVRCIAAAGPDAMWVGLAGAGLARVALGTDGRARVRAVDRDDGLHDDTVNSLLDDGAGRLWMGTPHGIAVVRIADLEARLAGGRAPLRPIVFDEGDGMATRQCTSGGSAAVRGRDGRLWFATRDGAVGIDAREALTSRERPVPVIEEVAAEGLEVPAARGVVTLAPALRNFSVRYTALGSVAPAQLRFRYRLHGVDHDWVEAGPRREAFYTHVPAGRLRFDVQVSDRFGRWNPARASTTLWARPAFHESAWFRALVALALLALTAGAARWRERWHLRREAELAAQVRARTRELEEALRTVAAQTRSLEDLDRAKSRFFANISHEFRTPLTLTLGPLEDVLSGATGTLPGEARTELEVALRNSRRLLQLVNEILDLAKLESGRMRLAVREDDLRIALADWAQSFHPLAERRRITYDTALGDAPLPVWFDRERLGKAVTNLLSNAFKFTPEGGRVTLAAAPADGGVRIDVRDTGPGIPEAERERIFERFYQVDETRRRLTPGTGIGLALARELVELHGGRIEVASREGEGATFTVWLRAGREHLRDAQVADGPATAQEPTAVEPAALEPPPAALAAPEPEAGDVTTVLVVDDHDELRALVRRGLAPHYRVLEARDGAEALRLARANPPDLVVSDVMMPGMDGFALVEAFRADPDLDFVPVVLLTARAESEDRIAGLRRGADDYVEKPFRGEELRARVDNLIATRRRLRERYGRDFRIASTAAPADALDRAWLERLREVVGARLGEEDFNVAALADAMRQDRTQLFRRVRELLDTTPTDLLRNARLDRAAELLRDAAGGIGEVAYATGFKSVSHFSQCFRERFGRTPSAFAREEARRV